jgi:hypothetical protein
MASTWVRIRNTIVSILGIGAKIAVAVGSTAAGIPGVPLWAARTLGMVPFLMEIYETAMPDPGSGPTRKTNVINATKKLYEFLEKNIVTGGAQGTFEKLQPQIELIIEATVGAVNAIKPEIVADDLPPDHPSNLPGA